MKPEGVEAYPLHWPSGWPRTKQRVRSSFKVTHGRALSNLTAELARLGARHVVVSSNVPLRRDGLPYANMRRPDDPGVAVYFTLNGRQQCIPCDRWWDVHENIQAIAKTVDALRGLERWGAKHMVDAAFRGFEALPSHAAPPWWQVLGFESGDVKIEEVRARYRELALLHHPDKGGDTERMASINAALRTGLREARP